MSNAVYPSWRYHQEKCPEGCIIQSAEQEAALGEGWVDTPAKFEVVEQKPEPICLYAEKVQEKEPKEEKPAKEEKPKKTRGAKA